MPVSAPPPPDLDRASDRRPTGLTHPLPAGMRDLLPAEARRQQRLARALLGTFERHGYELVSVPSFEYADVLERELGDLDPGHVLRFVEPETGEVVALRPDMTPQIARLICSRLPDAPPPLRLCYEGAVVRRRRERARRDRQIYQAGIELVGLEGAEGDLEVLSVASAAMHAAGLEEFTLDLGHAMIAGSLVRGVAAEAQAGLVEALSGKNTDEVRRRAEQAGISGQRLAALTELPTLYGGPDVWTRAERVLRGTPAAEPAAELRRLTEAVLARDLVPELVVDLGETWSFFYYTGAMFRILAEGPGEPVVSGGRYDQLFERFGSSRAAAGFAIDVGNLAWALEQRGRLEPAAVKLLVSASAAALEPTLAELRRLGIACVNTPGEDPTTYAQAWRYTHLLEVNGTGAALVELSTRMRVDLEAPSPAVLATRVAERVHPQASGRTEMT